MEKTESILDQIKSMWKEDAQINEGNIAKEIANVPLLHSKYTGLLADTRRARKRTENKLLRLQKDKIKYYKGEMTKDDLVKHGWNQYQGNKILKSEMSDVLKMDEDIMVIGEEVYDLDVVIQLLESIVKEINSRNYSLRTHVDWTKMMNGLN